jgi:hypothetical protein
MKRAKISEQIVEAFRDQTVRGAWPGSRIPSEGMGSYR